MSSELFSSTKSPADKRQLILDATLCLLSTRGFHGFSIKQVAEKAEVAAGTIYLYFKDKNALIEQLHLAIIREIAEAAFVDLKPEQTAFEQYRSICINLWRFCLQHPEITFSKGQFDHLPPEVLRDQYTDAKILFKPLLDLFDRCRNDGTLAPMPNEVLASLAIDSYWQLARKHRLGLVEVDDGLLDRVIAASWKAISMTQ